ncbi:MAG TPA: hypothetical protein VG323_11590, partial [Thermoanaerobaculia bacterium]|nr:hypothetical protein [Thermoanaerobaculia bacterium]
FQTVNGGAIAVGTSVNPVGGKAIVFTNVSGDYSATSVNAFGTAGLSVSGTGLFTGLGGMRLAVGGGALSGSAGAGLSVSNTTIGSSGLNFTSINSTNGVNGIVLNNTDTAGGLTVSGTGAANSGGTIQNATGDGISLTQTKGVSFTDMRVLTSGQSHIKATNVNGLTLTRVSTDLSTSDGILGNTVRNLVINGGLFDRGGAGSGSSGVNGVTITNLLGNSSVSGATFRRSNTLQFRVSNSTATNAAPGAPDVLTFSGTTFDTHTSPFAGDHLSVSSTGGGNLRLVTNSSSGTNSFTGAGNAIQATADSGGTLDLSATAVSSSGNVSAFNVGGSNNGKMTFSITNNANLVNSGSIGINVTSVSGAVVSGTISGNTVTNAFGTGIQAIEEGNGSIVVAIANNIVTGTFNTFGIRAQARLGTGLLSANITGNSVIGTDPAALNAVSIESGASGSGHANTVCLNMANNVATLSNGGAGYRLRQRVGTIFNLQDFTGSGTSATDVANWINVTKNNTGTTSVTIGSSFSAASGACQTP